MLNGFVVIGIYCRYEIVISSLHWNAVEIKAIVYIFTSLRGQVANKIGSTGPEIFLWRAVDFDK